MEIGQGDALDREGVIGVKSDDRVGPHLRGSRHDRREIGKGIIAD